MILKPKIIEPYNQLLTKFHEYVFAFLASGRGSGKSQSACKSAISLLMQNSNFRIALIRSENTRLEQGIFTLFKMRANEIDDKSNNAFSLQFEILDTKIKNRQGDDVVFNYGLKSSQSTSLESKKGKVKGLERINLAIIEECQDIKDWEVIKTLIDTCIREKDFKIWFLFNPPKNRDHWLYRHFYDLVPSKYDEYDELKPKELNGVLYLHSDYTQNPHLNEETIKRYASYKQLSNPDDYYHDILGLIPQLSKGNSIVKRFHESSFNYELGSPFINRMLDSDGYWFASFDGGEHTNRKACVLGYHVKQYDRHIVVKEFCNQHDSHDLREVALQVKEWMSANEIYAELKLFGDPVIHNEGVCHLIESVFDSKINTMQHFRMGNNAMLREIYQNRKRKRLSRLVSEMFELRSDNKPAIIILKDGCPKLKLGFFEGLYRYELNNNGEPTENIEQFVNGEYKHLTDICDAFTYYLLASKPFTAKEQDREYNNLNYNNARLGW